MAHSRPYFNRQVRVAFEGVPLSPVINNRVTFEVDKHDGQVLNRATIRIYNLSPNARSVLARPIPLPYPLVDPQINVALFAGYETPIRLMAGQLLFAVNSKIGPDWITEMQVFAGMGASAFGDATVSFAKPTAAKVIADAILAPLKLDVRYTQAALGRLQNERATDIANSGSAFRIADDFLRRYGLRFTIEDDGQGLVYVEDQPRNPEAGKTRDNTFSPQTGLVGTPQITRIGVEITALLRPRIRILDRFFVESETITGTLRGQVAADYFVRSVRHVGDTHGEAWFTEIEGIYSSAQEGIYP